MGSLSDSVTNDARQNQDTGEPDKVPTTPVQNGPTHWNGDYNATTYSPGASGLGTSPPAFSEASGDSSIAVNSRALLWYADRIEDLQQPVIEARNKLDAIRLAPGRFKTSQALQSKLESGVITSFSQTFQRMLPALSDLSTALRQLAKDYDTAEELSSEAGLKALGTALNDFDQTSAGASAA